MPWSAWTPAWYWRLATLFCWSGRRSAVVSLGKSVGDELPGAQGMDVVMVRRVGISNSQYLNRSVKDILDSLSQDLKHGVYAEGLIRAGSPVPITAQTMVMPGDVVTLFGTPQDVQKAAQAAGPIIVPSDKTDWVFHGFGIVVGLLIGLLVLRIGAIPITGSGGGGACSRAAVWLVAQPHTWAICRQAPRHCCAIWGWPVLWPWWACSPASRRSARSWSRA
jgi:uncharacterized transporter YbjL